MTPSKSIHRKAVYFIAGAAVALAVGSRAEIAQLIGSDQQTPGCGELQKAIADAVNNKARMIALTSPDPSKYFAAGSPDSCIGGLSIANIDLSGAIPDPLGLLSGGIDSVLDSLKKAAVGAACTAARNSVGETIAQYNAAVTAVNGDLNMQGKIDSAIGAEARRVADGYAMNWRAPQVTDITAAIKSPTLAAPSPRQTPAPTPVQQSQVQAPAPTQGIGSVVFGR